MTETKDIYWLAGLLEGEGSFIADGRFPKIALKMNDRDVVQRAQELLRPKPYRANGNAIKYYEDKTAIPIRKYWFASISGRRAVGWMLTLYPLMGERRK